MALSRIISDVAELFYPNLCLACGEKLLQGEAVMCYQCRKELPVTNYWHDAANPMAQRFWGRVELQGAMAMFKFQKDGDIQHLLHQLKYRGRQDAGEFVGRMIGAVIKQPGSVIKHIDLVVPVPLHAERLRQRGYNQSDAIARGIADATGIAWSNTALARVEANTSQTGKNRFQRWESVATIFAITDTAAIKNKHVLLVDDVMTTGATAEACLQQIVAVEGTKASLVTAAVVIN